MRRRYQGRYNVDVCSSFCQRPAKHVLLSVFCIPFLECHKAGPNQSGGRGYKKSVTCVATLVRISLSREMVGKTRKARGSYRGCLTPARLVEAKVGMSFLTLLLASSLRAAFVSVSVLQFAQILAQDHSGVCGMCPQPPLAAAVAHRPTQVSGPRGCRALPPHFPRCSLGAFRRIGAAMAR